METLTGVGWVSKQGMRHSVGSMDDIMRNKAPLWQNQRKHTSLNTKLRKVLAGEISRAFLQSTPQSSAPLPLPTYLVMYTYLGAGLDPCK